MGSASEEPDRPGAYDWNAEERPMTEYKADLPEGMALPPGSSINVEHADYKALTAVAREEGWSQKSFSRVLGLEVARHARAAPAPAASAPVAPPVNFDKRSTAEQFAHALSTSKRTR
jgi:hypothetical protein